MYLSLYLVTFKWGPRVGRYRNIKCDLNVLQGQTSMGVMVMLGSSWVTIMKRSFWIKTGKHFGFPCYVVLLYIDDMIYYFIDYNILL